MVINRNKVYEFFHDNAKELIAEYLQPDGQGKGWICPLCGNGSGEDGDGLIYNPNAKEAGHFHCFVCGFDGDLIDLIGEEYGITNDVEKQNKASELFGITLLNPNEITKNDFKKINPNNQTPAREITPLKIKNDAKPDRKEAVLTAIKETLDGKQGKFTQLHNKANSQLNNPASVKELKRRGITSQNPFLKDMGYIENMEIGGINFNSCIAFFSSNSSYAVRDTNPEAEPDRKTRKPAGTIDIPIGLVNVIKNKDKKLEGTNILEPVFICEGLFDAPSIAEAGGEAIALNGTYNINPVIWAFREYGIKRPLILTLDNDSGGDTGLKKLKRELDKTYIEYYEAQLIPEALDVKDPNEFLMLDREVFKTEVQRYRHFPIKEFEKTFNKNKKDKLKSKLLEKFKNPGIKTGFNFLDGKNFLDGGLYSGLYVIGAISSLGKTTFALQLADQIAKSGHDVIFFSLEMPEVEIMGKSISRYTLKELLDSGELIAGDKPDNRAKTLYDIYRNYTIDPDGAINKALENYFNDTGEHLRIIEGMGDINAEVIAGEIEKHYRNTGKAPVIFIDYLQLLTQPNDKKHSMTDKQITDANIFQLKQLSRDYNIPIFGISSFNRENYNEPVSMKSFKESGAIEYSSDVLIGLEPEYMGMEDIKKRNKARTLYKKMEKETGIRAIRLVMLKNRNGRAGGVDLFYYYPRFNLYSEQGFESLVNDLKRLNFN